MKTDIRFVSPRPLVLRVNHGGWYGRLLRRSDTMDQKSVPEPAANVAMRPLSCDRV